jgi:hypothetical protein
MGAYVPTGPWTNGAAPGISASFLGTLENWIQQTEGDIGGASVSGSTSGTATLYQTLQGTAKYVLIVVSSNYNSTLKTIALPVAFTTRASVRAYGNNGPMRFLTSGTGQGMFLVNGFNVNGTATTTASVTSLPANMAGGGGSINGPFDTVEFSATGTVGAALVILEGS